MKSIVKNYLNNKIKKKRINKNRQHIYKELFAHFRDINFKYISSSDLKTTFDIYDKFYFDGELRTFIESTGIIGKFIASDELDKTAGKLCHRRNSKNFKFYISSYILNQIFTPNKEHEKKRIGGYICQNKLECFILLFEHELVHLILLLSGLAKEEESHWKTFEKLIKNMFSQTEFTHQLLIKGDIVEIEKHIDYMKLILETGFYIKTTKINDKYFMGKVVKIDEESVQVELKNGDIVLVEYFAIKKIFKPMD